MKSREGRRTARRARRASVLAVAAGAVIAALGLSTPVTASADQHASRHHDRSCRNGYVGLTYDDGPSTTTPQLLAALRKAGLRATMFNQGNNAEANPKLVRDQLRAGMWVGNHTFTHPHLTAIPAPQAFQEIASTQWVLTDITRRVPTLFRPPFGETGPQVRADAERMHLLEVLWTVDSRDWAGASAEQIVAAARTLQPGGILLMHDWPPATIAAVPGIRKVLADRGLCSGRIGYTPRDVSGAGSTFHAVAVRP